MAHEVEIVYEEQWDTKKRRKSCAGRKLMRWDPAVDQLALLAVDKVCVEHGIIVPWDVVAKEIREDLSGEALKQHMVKLRVNRELVGQKVPEKLERGARRKATMVHDQGVDAPLKKVVQDTNVNGPKTSPKSKDISKTKYANAPKTSGLLFQRPRKNTAKKEGHSLGTDSLVNKGKKNVKRTGQYKRKSLDEDTDTEVDTPLVKAPRRDYSFRVIEAVDYTEPAIDAVDHTEPAIDAIATEDLKEQAGINLENSGKITAKEENNIGLIDAESPLLDGNPNAVPYTMLDSIEGLGDETEAIADNETSVEYKIYGNGTNAYHGDAAGIVLESPTFGFEYDAQFPFTQNNVLPLVPEGDGYNDLPGLQPLAVPPQPNGFHNNLSTHISVNTNSHVTNSQSLFQASLVDHYTESSMSNQQSLGSFNTLTGNGLSPSDQFCLTDSPDTEANSNSQTVFHTPGNFDTASLRTPRTMMLGEAINPFTSTYAAGSVSSSSLSNGVPGNYGIIEISNFTTSFENTHFDNAGIVDTNGISQYQHDPTDVFGLGLDLGSHW